MPRSQRLDIGDNYYHVLNRANARLRLFFNEADYQLIEEATELRGIKGVRYAL